MSAAGMCDSKHYALRTIAAIRLDKESHILQILLCNIDVVVLRTTTIQDLEVARGMLEQLCNL